MSKPVLSESLPTPKVGQLITWMTSEGPDLGVVVGGDAKDVLAVTAYDRSLKNDVSSKKFRDDALTARIADKVKGKIASVMYDVHRVPKSLATLVGRLKGKGLQRYQTLASTVMGKKEDVDGVDDVLMEIERQFAGK